MVYLWLLPTIWLEQHAEVGVGLERDQTGAHRHLA